MALDAVTAYGAGGSEVALDHTIARGVTWLAGVKAATVAVSWLCTIAIARILTPQDYGIFTMAFVFVGFTLMFTDFGFGAGIIALPELNENVAAQLHSAAALFGVAAFGISCIAALPISRFFRTPAVMPVMIVISTIVIAESLRLVPMARLGRELRFKDLALLDACKGATALLLAVPLALAGARYWTLVVGNVIAAFVVTAIVLARARQPFAMPVVADLKPALKFSSRFVVNVLAWYGYTNADFAVAGRVLGKVPLGEYNLAWTLVSAPGDKIMSIFGQVMPMVLSSVQRDVVALRRYFLLFTEALGILIIPATAGLAVVAHDFVLLVFGAKWEAAALPLQLLALYMAIHILGTPCDRLLQSTGQPGFPARCRLVMLVLLPLTFYLSGLRWGTAGIAAAWLVVYPLLLAPIFSRAFRTIGLSVRQYAVTLTPTAASAAAMVIVVVTLRALVPARWPLSVRFSLEVAGGGVAFVALALLIQRRRLATLLEFVRAVRA